MYDFKKEKVKAEEMAKMFSKLSEDDRLIIYYMTLGAVAVSESSKQPA